MWCVSSCRKLSRGTQFTVVFFRSPQNAGILKEETSYSASKPPGRSSGKPRLVWNDAEGGPIEEVHFAERLHYSLKEDEASALEQ